MILANSKVYVSSAAAQTPFIGAPVGNEIPEWLMDLSVTKNDNGTFSITSPSGEEMTAVPGKSFWCRMEDPATHEPKIVIDPDSSFYICNEVGEKICSVREFMETYEYELDYNLQLTPEELAAQMAQDQDMSYEASEITDNTSLHSSEEQDIIAVLQSKTDEIVNAYLEQPAKKFCVHFEDPDRGDVLIWSPAKGLDSAVRQVLDLNHHHTFETLFKEFNIDKIGASTMSFSTNIQNGPDESWEDRQSLDQKFMQKDCTAELHLEPKRYNQVTGEYIDLPHLTVTFSPEQINKMQEKGREVAKENPAFYFDKNDERHSMPYRIEQIGLENRLQHLQGYNVEPLTEKSILITPEKQFSNCRWKMEICENDDKVYGRVAINDDWVTDLNELKQDHDKIFKAANTLIQEAKGIHIQEREHDVVR